MEQESKNNINDNDPEENTGKINQELTNQILEQLCESALDKALTSYHHTSEANEDLIENIIEELCESVLGKALS